MEGEAAGGRDHRLLAEPYGVAAASGELAPELDECLPEGCGLLADGSVGGNGTPGDEAAFVEEAGEGGRVPDHTGVQLHADDVGTGRQCDRQCAVAAHVHADGAAGSGQCSRQQIAGGLGVEQWLVDLEAHEAGFVEEQDDFGVGEPQVHGAHEAARPGVSTLRAATECFGGVDAELVEREPEGERTGHLQLDRGGPAGERDARVEEAEQAAVRERVERGVDAAGCAGADVDEGEAAVVSNGDLGQRAQPLGEHSLACAAARELRRGGQIGVQAQHQCGSCAGIGVRQAADRCGEASPQHCACHTASYYTHATLPPPKASLVSLWIARLLWITLPVTLGAAVADAVDGWSSAPKLTFAVLLYAAWTGATIALLVTRPMSFTMLRLAAPLAPAIAIWALIEGSSGWRGVALVHAIAAAVAVLREPVASACSASAAYGDEQRFALRVPPAFLLVLALSVAACAFGVATGPVLLADRHWVLGPVAIALGGPIAFAAARSVHTLARRFIVLVPAGLVVSDSLMLSDPVLLPRDNMIAIGLAEPTMRGGDDVVDTRLGAVIGGCFVQMDDGGQLSLRRGGRRTTLKDANTVLFTPLRAAVVLKAAGAHRLPVSRAS